MMGKMPDTQRDELNSDSLDSYMRGLNGMGDYSPEQQAVLCRNFEQAADDLRCQVCRLGFTAAEYLRSIVNILENGGEAADVFLISSLRSMGESKAEQFAVLRKYQQEIQEKYTAFSAAFAGHAPETEKLHDELAATLMRYRLSLQKVYEMVDAGRNYLRMLDMHFDWERPLTTGNGVPADFIEEKMLMRLPELIREAETLGQCLHKLYLVRNELVEANLKLVVSIARRYCNHKVVLGDLIQEGNLGLLRALERIDFSLGYRFSTYASWWIRHRIARAVNNSSRVIRLPMHMVSLINDINQAEQRFIQFNDRMPEIEELARMLELPVARVSAVKKMAVQTISLQSHISGDDESAELGDFIADNAVESPAAELNRRITRERLYDMLKTLTEREQQLLIMRFGLFGQPVFTLAEISNHFKLTKERCRQIECNLLMKLRSPEKLKYFDGAVDFDEF